MAARRCPSCGLVSPATAVQCDCGRSFVDGSLGPNLRQRRAGRRFHVEPEKLRELALRNIEIARNWLLCAGLIIFIVDQLFINGWYGTALGDAWRLAIVVGEVVVVIALVLLYRARRPFAMFVVAGIGYGAVYVSLAGSAVPSYGIGYLLHLAYAIGLLLGGARAIVARRWLLGLAAVQD
jgi:hypothetical protein